MTATAPATAEAALPPWPPESGSPLVTESAIPRPPARRLARRVQHRARGQRRGMARGSLGELGMARVAHVDARLAGPLGSHRVARAGHRQPEDVEPGADVAHAAGREGGDGAGSVSCAGQPQDVVEHAGRGHLGARRPGR